MKLLGLSAGAPFGPEKEVGGYIRYVKKSISH
jgi:hypothetical protein